MSLGVNSLLDDLWNGYREGDGISEPLDIEEETLKIVREREIPIEWVAIPQDGQALDSAESALPCTQGVHPSFMNRWQAFIAQFEPGDELREFCSSPKSWRHCAGRAGYVRMRNGKAIASLLTIMN